MKRLILLLIFLAACSQVPVDTTIKPGNEGFTIGNGSIAVVLAHGIGASPYEVKGLSEYLAQRNLTVVAVRLAGHGTSVEDLSTKTWQDWQNDFENAYHSLHNKKIFVGGMSLGGLLALKMAEDNGVSGVIALAPAMMLDDTRSNYAWFFKYFVKYSSRLIPVPLQPYYYDRFPVAAIAQMVELGKIVRKDLAKITKPILIMQYTNDTRVDPRSSQIIYESVSSQNKKLIRINGTGHVFLLDNGKEKYFEEIYQFIKANS